MLNGPDGQVEQTFWYLDPQSVSDWHALSNSEQYITLFRSKLPLDKLAERIVKLSKGIGPSDVDGAGGRWQDRNTLCNGWPTPMPLPPDLQLYLLRYQPCLVAEAYRTARLSCTTSNPGLPNARQLP